MKTQVKHTPGIWEVTGSGDAIEVMVKDGASLVVIFNERGKMANARLLASSPELLFVCNEILSAMTDKYQEDTYKEFPLARKLEKVIREAEGL